LFSGTYRQRTLFAWAVWALYLFSYFGMLLWLPTLLTRYKGLPGSQVFPYMMGFLACGVLGRLACSLLIDRLGRKPVLTIAGGGAGVLLLTFGQQQGLAALMVVGYAYAFFQDMGASAVTPIAPELYPTRLRATGAGWAAGAGRFAAVLAPIAVGQLVEVSLAATFAMLAAGLLGTAAVALVFGRETTGLPLEALETNSAGVAPDLPAAVPRPESVA